MQTNSSTNGLSAFYNTTKDYVASGIATIKENPLKAALVTLAIGGATYGAYCFASARDLSSLNIQRNATGSSVENTSSLVKNAIAAENTTTLREGAIPVNNFTNILQPPAESIPTVRFYPNGNVTEINSEEGLLDDYTERNLSTTESLSQAATRFILSDWSNKVSSINVTPYSDYLSSSIEAAANQVSVAKAAALTDYSFEIPSSIPYIGGTTVAGTGLVLAGYAAAGLTGVVGVVAAGYIGVSKLNQLLIKKLRVQQSFNAGMDLIARFKGKTTKAYSFMDSKAYQKASPEAQKAVQIIFQAFIPGNNPSKTLTVSSIYHSIITNSNAAFTTFAKGAGQHGALPSI